MLAAQCLREDRDAWSLCDIDRSFCDLEEFSAVFEDDLLTERFGMLGITLLDAIWHLGDEFCKAGLVEMT